MASRDLKVVISGDAASLNRALKSSGAHLEHFDKAAKRSTGHIGGLSTGMGKAAGGVERHGKRMEHSFGRMATSAAKTGAAFAAAYVSIEGAKHAVETTKELAIATERLSLVTGLNTKTASEYAATANVLNIPVKQLSAGFVALAKSSNAAEAGGKKQTAAYKDLGISAKDIKETHGDLNELFQLTSDRLGKVKDGSKRAADGTVILGKGFASLSRLTAEGSKGIQENLDLADKYGATFGGKPIKSIKDLEKAQKELKFAQLGLSIQFTEKVAPALIKVTLGAIHLGQQLGQKLGPIIKSVTGFLKHHGTEAKFAAAGLLAVGVAVKAISFGNRIAEIGRLIASTRLLGVASRTTATEMKGLTLVGPGGGGRVPRVGPVAGGAAAAGGFFAFTEAQKAGDFKILDELTKGKLPKLSELAKVTGNNIRYAARQFPGFVAAKAILDGVGKKLGDVKVGAGQTGAQMRAAFGGLPKLFAANDDAIKLFARDFRTAFVSAGAISKRQTQIIIDTLGGMTPGARTKARDAMIAMAKQLEASGQIPKGSAKRLAKELGDAFVPIGAKASKAADRVGDATARIVKFWQDAASSVPSSITTINDAVRGLVTATTPSGQTFTGPRRKGGVVGFQGGGMVPSMVSPGELIEYGGNAITVPGARVAADSVFMPLPVGARVFTGSGQAMMAGGMHPDDALAAQAPHFARGGKVQRFSGGGSATITGATPGRTYDRWTLGSPDSHGNSGPFADEGSPSIFGRIPRGPNDGPWWGEGNRRSYLGHAMGGARGGQAILFTHGSKSTVAVKADVGKGNTYGDIFPQAAKAIGWTIGAGPLKARLLSDGDARSLLSGSNARGGSGPRAATGGRGSGWHKTGFTIDPGSDPKQTANGGMSFAELLLDAPESDNRAYHSHNLSHVLGIKGDFQGMPIGKHILVRAGPGHRAYDITKSDNGSGSTFDQAKYTIDLHREIANKIGKGGKGFLEVARVGTPDAGAATVNGRNAPPARPVDPYSVGFDAGLQGAPYITAEMLRGRATRPTRRGPHAPPATGSGGAGRDHGFSFPVFTGTVHSDDLGKSYKTPAGKLANFRGSAVAPWIYGQLNAIEKRSGRRIPSISTAFRPRQYQQDLINTGRYVVGQNIAPAGKSQHQHFEWGQGAVDIPDAGTMNNLLRYQSSKFPRLHFYQNPSDRVHFSGTGFRRGGTVGHGSGCGCGTCQMRGGGIIARFRKGGGPKAYTGPLDHLGEYLAHMTETVFSAFARAFGKIGSIGRSVTAEIGRRGGQSVLRSTNVISRIGDSQTGLGNVQGLLGIDPASVQGIGMGLWEAHDEQGKLAKSGKELGRRLKQAQKLGNKKGAARISAQLGEVAKASVAADITAVGLQRDLPHAITAEGLQNFDLADAEASLTADTADDRTALLGRKGFLEGRLADARSRGDKAAIIELIGALKSTTEALNQQDQSQADLAAALKGVQDELKTMNDHASAVSGTSTAVLWQALSDLISGNIVGKGIVPRSFTPGDGTVATY